MSKTKKRHIQTTINFVFCSFFLSFFFPLSFLLDIAAMYLLNAKKVAERKAKQEEMMRKRQQKVAEAVSAVDEQQQREAEELRIAMERSRQEERRRMQEERRRAQEEAEIQEALRRSIQSEAEDQRRREPQRTAPHFDAHAEIEEWRDVKIYCKYIGTFEAGAGPENRESIKRGIAVMTEYVATGRPAYVLICLEGIKVIDGKRNELAMAHALQNVTMCTVDKDSAMFAFVARDPNMNNHKYCHVFQMSKSRHAQSAHALVSKAFKLAFYKHRSIKKPTAREATPPAMQARPEGRRWAKHNPLQGVPHHRMAEDGRRPTSPARSVARVASRTQQENSPSAPPLQVQSPPLSSPLATSQSSITDMPQASAPPRRNSSSTPEQHAPVAIMSRVPADRVIPSVDLADDVAGLSLVSEEEMGAHEDEFLQNAPWYQAGLPREIAIELLTMSEDGAFLVRESQSQPGNFALTMKAQDRIHNFIIKKCSGGYILGGEEHGEKVFYDLGELILFHAEYRGILPIELSLDAMNALCDDPGAEQQVDRDSYIDPDYQSLKLIRF
eukprot:m.160150 g.160150  ORF g.160150 m.160150 type:complete len:555 (+) comp16355_c2_seq3:207-1871(+)